MAVRISYREPNETSYVYVCIQSCQNRYKSFGVRTCKTMEAMKSILLALGFFLAISFAVSWTESKTDAGDSFVNEIDDLVDNVGTKHLD